MARKQIVLTDEQISMLSKYAAVGLTLDQMAALVDCCPTTFDEIIKRQEGVKRAIEKGRAKGIGGIANTLYQQAMKGNITAAIFYLKVKGRWSEANPGEYEEERYQLPASLELNEESD